jgi:hypothetical protein
LIKEQGKKEMELASPKVWKKVDEIVSRHIAGETILVPIRGKLADMQCIFVLDTVGEYIWDQLDGLKSLDEICEGILDNFEVEREQAETDLQEFIAELVEASLVMEMA